MCVYVVCVLVCVRDTDTKNNIQKKIPCTLQACPCNNFLPAPRAAALIAPEQKRDNERERERERERARESVQEREREREREVVCVCMCVCVCVRERERESDSKGDGYRGRECVCEQ